MTCRICGRDTCTECFHSIEEQEEFEDLQEEARLMTEPLGEGKENETV